jgi:putative transcriptional regulator
MFWRGSRAALAFCLLLAFTDAPLSLAQDKPNKRDTEDKPLFLVARPELQDPFFKEAVVVMFPSSVTQEGLVVGLIINRSGRIPLSQVFPDDVTLKDRFETAYFGGPVDPRAPGVVFRSSKPAKQATLLFGDVYVSFDSGFVKDLLKKQEETPDLRLFVGRSQWLPLQLQVEMAAGAWYSVHAETSLIFSKTPQSLWRILFDRAEPHDVARVRNLSN